MFIATKFHKYNTEWKIYTNNQLTTGMTNFTEYKFIF